jgi:hypothetical protein
MAIRKPFECFSWSVKEKLSESRTNLNPPYSPFCEPLGMLSFVSALKSFRFLFFVSGLTKLRYGVIKQQAPVSAVDLKAL